MDHSREPQPQDITHQLAMRFTMMELSSLMETDKQSIMMQRQAIDLANTLKWYISDLQLVKIK